MKRLTKEWGRLYLGALSMAKNADFDTEILENATKDIMEVYAENEKCERSVSEDFSLDDFCEERITDIVCGSDGVKIEFGKKSLLFSGAAGAESEAPLSEISAKKLCPIACELYNDKGVYELCMLLKEESADDGLFELTLFGKDIAALG